MRFSSSYVARRIQLPGSISALQFPSHTPSTKTLSGETRSRTRPSTGMSSSTMSSAMEANCSPSMYETMPPTPTAPAVSSMSAEFGTPETCIERFTAENPSISVCTAQ